MDMHAFPVIDLVATGDNIRRLRLERGLSVRDLQTFFGFEQPQAIYKWQKGASLPTVDNLYALGSLFGVPMDQILVPVAVNLHPYIEQQDSSCCSSFYGDTAEIEAARSIFCSRLPGRRAANAIIKETKPFQHFMETCARDWGKGGRGKSGLTHLRQGEA